MIQPLQSSKTSWLLHWIDLEEPVPAEDGYMLPTLLIVSDERGIALAAPEVMEELDQDRAEGMLANLFELKGRPDRLTISESEDWDVEGWKAFSREQSIELRFRKFPRPDGPALAEMARTIISGAPGPESAPGPTPEAVAAGLLRVAGRLRSHGKRLTLLSAALRIDPGCAPARVEMADYVFQQGKWKEALAGYGEVIARESPKWEKTSPAWWSDPATRPLLRARYGKAMTLWQTGDHHGAAEEFLHILERNPADHQGVRFLIPMVWMLAERLDAAGAYFSNYGKTYPDDFPEPAFLFGKALWHYLEGDEAGAKKTYRRAMLKNFYIAPLLVDAPAPPSNLWHPGDRAERPYAEEFIDAYAVLWDRDSGSLRLVREVLDESRAEIERLVAHRAKMLDYQDQRYEPAYKANWQKLLEEDDRLSEPPGPSNAEI